MSLNRRDLLKLSAVGAACGLLPGVSSLAAARKKLPVALELYSVREICAKDFAGVLKATAEMGYDGVELAHTYHNVEAPALKKLLDQNKLKSCGMHLTLPALTGDAFKKTVDIHKVLGTPYLIIAGVPKKNLASKQACLDTSKLFAELAGKLKPHGLQLGYHCHAGDFIAVDGQTPWEIIGENTPADFIMQLDTCNASQGGADPVAMLKKFPGRAITVHLKEFDKTKGQVAVGDGAVKWDEVFAFCETQGGTKWYIVEDESQKGEKAIEGVRRCIQNLRKMGI